MATDDVAVTTKVNMSNAKVHSAALDALRKCWMRKDAKLCVNYTVESHQNLDVRQCRNGTHVRLTAHEEISEMPKLLL